MSIAIVSGAAGFIGSNFVITALKKDWFDKIIAIDKLSIGSNKEFIPNDDRIVSFYSDIADTPKEWLEQATMYYNFAAETHVDRSIINSQMFVQHNYVSLAKLLEKIKEFNSDLKFIQISTDEVYGHIFEGSFHETDPISPRNPYSATKAAAELLVQSFGVTHNLEYIITRSSNNYGPHQYEEKLLPKIISRFMNRQKIGIYGDGKQIRDWTYVEDNCRAIYLASQKGAIKGIYNIAANNELPNIEIVNKIANLMDINYEYIEYVKDRPGHDFRYSLQTDKIKSLGWIPSVSLEEGLLSTIKYYTQKAK